MSRSKVGGLRRAPPFAREVLQVAQREVPVLVFAGSRAWDEARRRSVLIPGSVLVLPPDSDPLAFDWTAAIQPDQPYRWPRREVQVLGEPMARVHVVGYWEPAGGQDPLERLSAALLLAGAARVEVTSEGGFERLTIRPGAGRRPAWMKR